MNEGEQLWTPSLKGWIEPRLMMDVFRDFTLPCSSPTRNEGMSASHNRNNNYVNYISIL